MEQLLHTHEGRARDELGRSGWNLFASTPCLKRYCSMQIVFAIKPRDFLLRIQDFIHQPSSDAMFVCATHWSKRQMVSIRKCSLFCIFVSFISAPEREKKCILQQRVWQHSEPDKFHTVQRCQPFAFPLLEDWLFKKTWHLMNYIHTSLYHRHLWNWSSAQTEVFTVTRGSDFLRENWCAARLASAARRLCRMERAGSNILVLGVNTRSVWDKQNRTSFHTEAMYLCCRQP